MKVDKLFEAEVYPGWKTLAFDLQSWLVENGHDFDLDKCIVSNPDSAGNRIGSIVLKRAEPYPTIRKNGSGPIITKIQVLVFAPNDFSLLAYDKHNKKIFRRNADEFDYVKIYLDRTL
jgi:hypothetical protein